MNQIPTTFDTHNYRLMNPDLSGLTDPELVYHYLQYGINEGRRYKLNADQYVKNQIDKSLTGIEIAPWFKPIIPKSEGFNVKVLDIYDEDSLLNIAKTNNDISSFVDNIEQVDFIGSACDIYEIVREYYPSGVDYILSSHNLEHLPNPINFLVGGEALLNDGGKLIMVIPDLRLCFDYYRFPTMFPDWLHAYKQNKQKPTTLDVFKSQYAFSSDYKKKIITSNLLECSQKYMSDCEPSEYIDCHVSAFTPHSLLLLLLECNICRISSLTLSTLYLTEDNDFVVSLEKKVGDMEKRYSREHLYSEIAREIFENRLFIE